MNLKRTHGYKQQKTETEAKVPVFIRKRSLNAS